MSEPGASAGDRRVSPGPADPAAFVATAYDRCGEGLYRYALMILGDPSGAEDAVQQAFARLVQMGDRVGGIREAGEYLRKAVRNECWGMLRRRRRRPERIDTVILEATDPGRVHEDERTLLEQALRSLPPEQREVVYLKVYEGRTFQDMADLLGISINTAASRYRYAMEHLRGRLDPRNGLREKTK
jgi:RNA polymerase sigma-70 factor (ECF subfamily)